MSSVANTLAIAGREIRAYFVSPLAYVVTALFLLISGFLFALIFDQTREATLRYLHSNVSVIWLFVVPALTMRLIAEESRTGTIELLLTNPVREYEVVLGKYIACLLLVLVMIAFTLYYPALLMFVGGNPDRGPLIAGYLGLVLQAGAFVAIGLMASALTENQIIAALLAFAIMLVMWLSDGLANALSSPVREVFRYLSITQHFQEFPRGVIDTTHVIFFLSLIVASLVLATLALWSKRWR